MGGFSGLFTTLHFTIINPARPHLHAINLPWKAHDFHDFNRFLLARNQLLVFSISKTAENEGLASLLPDGTMQAKHSWINRNNIVINIRIQA
jgi:hypothetical protein